MVSKVDEKDFVKVRRVGVWIWWKDWNFKATQGRKGRKVKKDSSMVVEKEREEEFLREANTVQNTTQKWWEERVEFSRWQYEVPTATKRSHVGQTSYLICLISWIQFNLFFYVSVFNATFVDPLILSQLSPLPFGVSVVKNDRKWHYEMCELLLVLCSSSKKVTLSFTSYRAPSCPRFSV